MGLFTSDEQKQKNLIQAQLEANKELATFTYNQNKQALDDERRYNSPSAQLLRLRSAGLNPLYFGLDGNSSNGAPFTMSTPNTDVGSIANAVQQQNTNMQAAFGQVFTASKNFAEIQQMQEQNKLIAAQTRRTNAEERNLIIDADWKPVKNGSELAVNGSIIRLNNSEVPKNESITDYQKQLKVQSEEQVKVLQAESDKTRAAYKELLSRIPLNQANTAVAIADRDLKKALGIQAKAQTGLIQQMEKTEKARTENEWEDNYRNQINNGYLSKLIQQEFRLKDASRREMEAHIKNFNALSKLYETEEQSGRCEMIFQGMKYGVLVEKDGKIKISAPKVLSQSYFNEMYNYTTKMQNEILLIAFDAEEMMLQHLLSP